MGYVFEVVGEEPELVAEDPDHEVEDDAQEHDAEHEVEHAHVEVEDGGLEVVGPDGQQHGQQHAQDYQHAQEVLVRLAVLHVEAVEVLLVVGLVLNLSAVPPGTVASAT
jgi:hypothetical protein